MFDGREGVLIKTSTGLTALGFLPAVAALIFGGRKTRLQTGNKNVSVVESTSQVHAVLPMPTPFLPLLPCALTPNLFHLILPVLVSIAREDYSRPSATSHTPLVGCCTY